VDLKHIRGITTDKEINIFIGGNIKMIKWISTETPPTEYSMTKEYFVTCEYNGQGNVNGRLTLL
jgi:hypothetical protein